MPSRQRDLFAAATPLPEGLAYVEDFLDEGEERALLGAIGGLDLQEARYKGYTARRRIASFGSEYDFDTNVLHPGPALPGFLAPLRERVAAWLALPAERLCHALVSEYRPGTALGWHRDVPQFELVAGVSLQGECRLRFRRYPHYKHSGEKPLELYLEPRSLYVMRGVARWGWQHSIAATPALRYSITLRTLSRSPGAAGPTATGQ
jgi:alkylated DNA repair dioxygenase AlkB